MWIGEVSGDVTKNNGYPLNPGEQIILELANLDHLWVDSEVNGEKVCWIRLQ